jgi:hypothetical protein
MEAGPAALATPGVVEVTSQRHDRPYGRVVSLDISITQDRRRLSIVSSTIRRLRTTFRRVQREAEVGASAVTPFYLLMQALAIVVPSFLIVLGLTELAYFLAA